MRKMVFLIPVLILVPAVLQAAEANVSFGQAFGPNFTDTRVRMHNAVHAQVFPFKKLNWLGASYSLRFDSYKPDVDEPFSIDKEWHSHAIGPVFKLPVIGKKKIQPWVSPSVVFYSEAVDVSLFGERLFQDKQQKRTISLEVGANASIWRGMFCRVAFGAEGTSRITWRTTAGIGWRWK